MLDKVLWILIRLFRVKPQIATQSRVPLFSGGDFPSSSLDALSTLCKIEVFTLAITTTKQYLQYLRILCYSLFSYVQFIRFYKQPMQDHIEAIAKVAIQILVNFPPDCVALPSLSHP